ncbi:DMT family transporter [Saccharibacillus alkalitolerans]|uniref:DMT family transporter n=1 Tax=Saccharibacillus alkalitolerans TaxID=2705290 RepID=A0ABX0F8H5_9BACL|nr:DMT family transporter [Saccharibacillus alkalitolerans]NGZ76690.1 DMT family transporter [Saccharibacillus alkalitolerans]
MSNRSTSRAYAAALSTALIIGFSFLFVKVALQTADPLDILAYRFLFAFAAASLFAFPGRQGLRNVRAGAFKMLPVALLYPIAFFGFQTFGLVHASSAEAGMIQGAVPVFTLILAMLLIGERTGRAQKAFTLLSVVGVACLFAGREGAVFSASLIGIMLVLCSAFSQAGYNVLARKLSGTYSPKELTYYMNLIGFVGFGLTSVTRHTADGTLPRLLGPLASPSFLLAMLYLGVLSSLVTSYLSNYALSRLEASRVSIFGSLSAVVALGAGALLLGERVPSAALLGAAAILAGVIGVALSGRRPDSAKAALVQPASAAAHAASFASEGTPDAQQSSRRDGPGRR